MSVLLTCQRAGSALGDRISPILLKELRQSVRSRAVIAVLMLLITGLTITTVIVGLLNTGATNGDTRGDQLFFGINNIVLIVCALFVPLYGAVRASHDRSGIGGDLMQTTVIGPASTIFGKVAVAMLVSCLLFSVATPFMAITYLFRGIDLPTIAFVIGMDLLIILAAVQVGIFVVSLPMGKVLRVLAGIILVPIFFMSLIGGGSSIAFMLSFGFGSSSVTQFDSDTWWGIVAAVGFVLAVIGWLFSLSVSMTAARSANRSLLARLYTTLFVIATFILALGISLSTQDAEPFMAWFSFASFLAAATILLSSSERRELGPRIKRRIPRNQFLRAFAFFFTSGTTQGLIWATSLSVFVSLAGYLTIAYLDQRPGIWMDDEFPTQAFIVTQGFTLAFTLITLFIRERVLRKWVPESGTAPLVLMAMMVVSIIPFIIAVATDPDNFDRESWYLILNPIGLLASSSFGIDQRLLTQQTFVVAALVLVGLVLNGRWLFKHIAAFRPPAGQTPSQPVVTPQTASVADEAVDA